MLKPAPPLFKARASSIGKLMTEPRTKKDKEASELSATAKTFITEWYKEQLYGRRKPLVNKYLTKGNECEDASIKLIDASWTNNKEQFSNDYMTGEPDVITDDEIIDIKNSWDCFTFPLFSKRCPSRDYEWQVLAYMELCGKRKGRVIYTLMDTPDSLIPIGENLADYKYEHLDKSLRVKEYVVDYDAEKIELIKTKVEKARAFIQALSF